MTLTRDHHPLLSDARKGDVSMRPVRIAKADAEKQIVYGVVYAPGEIDTDGETMLAPDIEQMAHLFMKRMAETKGAVIDVGHDNVAVSAYPVETFIETEEGKDWPVGSWVMGVKIEDPAIWKAVKGGKLNGFSFEAMTKKLPMVVEVEMEPELLGKTAMSEDHDHIYFLEFNEEGRVIGGTTSFDMGHRHEIVAGTATKQAIAPGINSHAHRLPM